MRQRLSTRHSLSYLILSEVDEDVWSGVHHTFPLFVSLLSVRGGLGWNQVQPCAF